MKKILLLIMIILFSSFVTAALNDAEVYYSNDNSDISGSTMIDSAGNTNCTINSATSGVDGILNQSVNYTGLDASYTDCNRKLMPSTANFSMSFWINKTANPISTEDILVSQYAASQTGRLSLSLQTSGAVLAASTDLSITSSVLSNGWHHIVLIRNGTVGHLCIDGSSNCTNDASWVDVVYQGQNTLFARAIGLPNRGFPSAIDEIGFWNRTLTTAEITELYNSGAGYNPFTPIAGDTINITDANPANNTQSSTSSINFNALVNATNTFNCSLYINSTLNQTLTGFSSGTDVAVNFSKTMGDGTWNHFINCFDSDTNENTTTNTFFVDSVDPAITWVVPSSANSTIVVGTLSTNITITDDNLYSYYYNITYPNGTVIANYSNNTLSGLTSYNIANNVSLSNYSGVFNAVTKVCDGHTAKKIKDFNVLKSDNAISFDEVTIRSLSSSYRTNYEKFEDRYKFSFDYSIPTSKIFVEVPEYCDYIPNSEYKGHFVCEQDNKWIDFEGDDYTVNVNGNVIEINSKIPKTHWLFNSIGELNCVTETSQIFVVNNTVSYTDNILAGTSNTFYFNLSYNSSWITDITAYLFYNGTNYTMTESLGTSLAQYSRSINAPDLTSNVSFYFNYDINSVGYNSSTYNQTVFQTAMDNCSTYSTRAINFTLRDELNDTILSGDFDYYISWSVGSINGSYNNSEDSKTNFSLCINPVWANFTGDITLQYSSTGYDSRDYVYDDYIFDNVTEAINLYAISSGVSSEVTIHVIDNSDNDLANVFIEAYRWDIPTNTDKLVETEYTDSDGNAVFNLKTGSEYYSFKFYQGGVLKLSTSRFKIFSSSLEYVLAETEVTRLQEWLQMKDVTRSLIYSNATNVITFSWDDSSGIALQFCLNVTDLNSSYYSSCSSTKTSSLTYTITDFNVSYVAIGTASYNSSGNWYVLETLSVSTFDYFRDKFGSKASLVLSFIMFLTISLLFLVSKNTAIVAGMFSMIVLYLFGALPIGRTSVMGICLVGTVILIILNKR